MAKERNIDPDIQAAKVNLDLLSLFLRKQQIPFELGQLLFDFSSTEIIDNMDRSEFMNGVLFELKGVLLHIALFHDKELNSLLRKVMLEKLKSQIPLDVDTQSIVLNLLKHDAPRRNKKTSLRNLILIFTIQMMKGHNLKALRNSDRSLTSNRPESAADYCCYFLEENGIHLSFDTVRGAWNNRQKTLAELGLGDLYQDFL